jgi:hypothetical protein
MLKPVKNNKQYEPALDRAYTLMQKDIKSNSKESDDLKFYLFSLKNMRMNITLFLNQIQLRQLNSGWIK